MWFWRRFFSFSVLIISFGLGLGLGLEPLWTRTWLGLEPLWTWTWLGLEPLWTWTCLGLDKGGLDYSPTPHTQHTHTIMFMMLFFSIRNQMQHKRSITTIHITYGLYFKTFHACDNFEWDSEQKSSFFFSWKYLFSKVTSRSDMNDMFHHWPLCLF